MDNLPDFIANLPTCLQILIGISVLFAMLWIPLPKFLFLALRYPMHKLWPKREGWSADCNEKRDAIDPNDAWKGGSATKWSHQKPQLVGDYFILDIFKSRVINRITLTTEGPRHPLEYMLSVKSKRTENWDDLGKYNTLDVKLPKSKKIVAIKWTITSPNTERWPDNNRLIAWAIFDIRLTEVRLFGRWWHKIIEER
jgi:hypothetical protein